MQQANQPVSPEQTTQTNPVQPAQTPQPQPTPAVQPPQQTQAATVEITPPTLQDPEPQLQNIQLPQTPPSQPQQATQAAQAPATTNQPTQTPVAPATTPQAGEPQNSQTQEQDTMLANAGEDSKLVDIEATGSQFMAKISKLVAFGLTMQGLYHIYKSLTFLFIEIPLLEEEIAVGTITRDEVIGVATHGFVLIVTAAISMFFALQLTFIKEKTAEKITSAIGILIFLGNAFIIDFFTQIEADILISLSFTSVLQYILNLQVRLRQNLPF